MIDLTQVQKFACATVSFFTIFDKKNMEIILISIVAFLVAILTFFSGFGLGTILTPVMMIFFPVDVAIALTGVVHFSNNIFKWSLL